MKNKTSQYFKYAIGEIVLVVIGILIALQINNWNENRKIENSKIHVLQNLKKEFESNLKLLKRQEDSITKSNRNLLRVINYSASSNKKIQIDSLKYYAANMFYVYNFSVKKSALDGVLTSGNILLLSDELNGFLTEFVTDFDSYKEVENLSTERITSSMINKLLIEVDFYKKFINTVYPNEEFLVHPNLTKNNNDFDNLIKSSNTYTLLNELLILELTRSSWTTYLKDKVVVIISKIEEELKLLL